MHKETSGIPTLLKNNEEFDTTIGKANILNTHFPQSVFTQEDLTNIPILETTTYPSISPTSFSTQGIESLLSNLVSNKAPRPDQIPSYILKHCAQEIAPILKVIFTQSLSSSSLPKDRLMANISPILRKVLEIIQQITGQSH